MSVHKMREHNSAEQNKCSLTGPNAPSNLPLSHPPISAYLFLLSLLLLINVLIHTNK